MQKMMKKVRIWFGLEEARWWDLDDAKPLNVINGAALAAALNRRAEART